jgi:hypothetical protein
MNRKKGTSSYSCGRFSLDAGKGFVAGTSFCFTWGIKSGEKKIFSRHKIVPYILPDLNFPFLPLLYFFTG